MRLRWLAGAALLIGASTNVGCGRPGPEMAEESDAGVFAADSRGRIPEVEPTSSPQVDSPQIDGITQ